MENRQSDLRMICWFPEWGQHLSEGRASFENCPVPTRKCESLFDGLHDERWVAALGVRSARDEHAQWNIPTQAKTGLEWGTLH
jgi:hypothetical protein